MYQNHSSKIVLVTLFICGTIFIPILKANNENVNNYNIEQQKNLLENNLDSFPICFTPEEQIRIDEICKGFQGIDPPPKPIRQPAEFEPMEGVLIRYPFGISYQIIAEMAEDVKVVTIVANDNEKNQVISQYQHNGVNLDNCDFLISNTDSYWTRDYGPWFIFNGNDEQGIIDHIYNRPRPNDDQIPNIYGNWQGIPVYRMNLFHSGGNYMTDGQGVAVSTNLVWSENKGLTQEEINHMLEEYLGINTYHVVPDVLGAYIKHIDCWAKFLAPDIIMIIEVQRGDPHYDDIEDAVEYFENQTSCYGTPYQIERVYTHTTSTNFGRPYINSLILNNKVLVPITRSHWDDEAIESYQTALPGYEVLGFYGSWESTDALHCRTMGITDRHMLYIEHTPLSKIQISHLGYKIEAKIIAYSGEDIISSTTGVYWRVEDGEWNFFKMESTEDDYYHAVIPVQEDNTKIYYYIHAEDESGRSENHPYIGASMAYSFNAFFINDPPEIINISGSTTGKVGEKYIYCIDAIDPDGDNLYFLWNWGDGETSDWLSENCSSHIWKKKGIYIVQVKVKDEFGAETDWVSLEVTMPREKRLLLTFFKNLQKTILY